MSEEKEIEVEVIEEKVKDNYFDNSKVEGMIDTYQNMDLSKDRETLGSDIMIDVQEIVSRIISCYDFSGFEEKLDLFQHASEACFKSIPKFDVHHPKYSSAFNWFSLVAKRSLLNYTIRKKKHRGHQCIDDHFEIEHTKREIDTNYLERDFLNKVTEIIDKNFLGQKRTNYTNITIILINYLVKTRKFKKNDFYAWARSHGFTNSVCREYLKNIASFYTEIIKDTLDI